MTTHHQTEKPEISFNSLMLRVLLFIALAALFIEGKHLAAGYAHFCHLQTNGQAYCHGWNLYGALGDGTNVTRAFPTSMLGVQSASDVCAGGAHSCVVENGQVKCVGFNLGGLLGDGSMEENRLVLAPIADFDSQPEEVSQVECGFYQTCMVLKQSGAVYCWGTNAHGELGDNSTQARYRPVPVLLDLSSSPGVTSVGTGVFHTCFITGAGGAKCVGSNSHGQLGDATTIDRLMLVQVAGLESNMVSIHAGYEHTCALNVQGGVLCWGGNSLGQLGNGQQPVDSNVPVSPIGMLDGGAKFVSVGYFNTFVLHPFASSSAFGDNSYSQFARKDFAEFPTPVQFTNITGVVEIRSGYRTTCVLLETGDLQCAGRDVYGQLGNGFPLQDSSTLVNALVSNPFTSTPTHSPTPHAHLQCKASSTMSRLQCTIRVKACNKLGISMKWVGMGCKHKRKRVFDGGCQCLGYCGFTCKRQCNRNSKFCAWNNTLMQCISKATGEPQQENKDPYCRL